MLPIPEPGLVIPYNYLWRHEHRCGQDEGRKTRSSVIILVVHETAGDAPRVTVVPITHSPPDKQTEAIELPLLVKQSLKLDGERSWIILDEVNKFTWPGYDLRPVAGSAKFHYGFIPPKLHDQVIARLLAVAADKRLAEISRD